MRTIKVDIIILGLLMHRGYTIYDLRKIINGQFTFASSGSMGNIQAAIKKLLSREMIVYQERLEKSVNKKVYFITDVGKQYFIEKISTPMQNKTRNMELTKLIFMGFTKHEEREMLIDGYVQELKEELLILEQINSQPQHQVTEESFCIDLTILENTLEQLKGLGGAVEFMTLEAIREIKFFQNATLNYGISLLKFEIQWFSNLKEKLRNLKLEE